MAIARSGAGEAQTQVGRWRAGGALLRLKLIGRMQACTEQGPLTLPPVRKTRAVLAVLALAAGQPVLRERLAQLLWSQRGRDQARASLRQSVHELQEALRVLSDDLLHADRYQLRLEPELVSVDLHDVARATTLDPSPLALLERPLLEDLTGLDPAFDAWIQAERRRITQGATALAEALLAEQQGAAAIVAAERVLDVEPGHESAWRALIGALAARGDRAGAIAAFERCSAALAQAAGLTPSAETLALLSRVRAPFGESGSGPTVTDATAAPQPTGPGPGSAPPGAASRPRRVRLGVMPLRALDASQEEPIALGLAEEITTALARFRWLFLISSLSLQHLVGTPPLAGEAWQRLDLDFLIDGSVQRGNGRVRVAVRLLDMRGEGEVIWTQRFERADDDILTLQSEVAGEIVAQVDPELLLYEGARAAPAGTHDVTAYDLLLRAIPAVYRLDESGFRAAGEMLAQAVARDPQFAAAHAWWAYWHVLSVGQRWARDEDAMARAGALAERAVRLDPSDARALTIAGHVEAFLHRRPDEAVLLHDRALQLNPNLPLAWALSGLALAYRGEHEEAIRRLLQAKRLSPFDPHAFFFDMALMMPHLLRGEFDLAVLIGRRAAQLNPGFTSTLKGYLAALGHLGRREETELIRARLLALEPGFTVTEALARSPLMRAEDRIIYAEGLRRAGLAEA